MILRSLLHKALTVTVGDVVHQIVLAPVGGGWYEAVSVPVEVCEILTMVKKSPEEYVVIEEALLSQDEGRSAEYEKEDGGQEDNGRVDTEQEEGEEGEETEEEGKSFAAFSSTGEQAPPRKRGRPRKNQ